MTSQHSSSNTQHSALSTQHCLLVTGGAGFIGSNFVHYWIKNYPDDRVVVLDSLTYAGNRANLEAVDAHPQFTFVHGDIRDYDLVLQLLEEEQTDTIVHFAAESHVDRSIHGPDAFVDTNIIGTHTLLKAAKKVWLDTPQSSALSTQSSVLSPQHSALSPQHSTLSTQSSTLSTQSSALSTQHSALNTQHSPYRFHHISTDEVYGSLGPDDPRFSETTAYAPNSPYAASKAGSDFLVRAYYKTYGLPMTISNCSNNYGPYQHPEKLIPLLILNCLEGRPLPIYGDGLNIRDWLFVEDHCRGIDRILQKGRLGETYNIGGNCEKTNLEVVDTVCAILEKLLPAPTGAPYSSLLTFIKDRPGHDRRYAIDTAKITSELAYTPQNSFDSGIRQTIEWYLENRKWCKNFMGAEHKKWLKKNYSE